MFWLKPQGLARRCKINVCSFPLVLHFKFFWVFYWNFVFWCRGFQTGSLGSL